MGKVIKVDFIGGMVAVTDDSPYRPAQAGDYAPPEAPVEPGEHDEAIMWPTPEPEPEPIMEIVPDWQTAVAEFIDGAPTGMVVIRAVEDNRIVDLKIDAIAAAVLWGNIAAASTAAATAFHPPGKETPPPAA